MKREVRKAIREAAEQHVRDLLVSVHGSVKAGMKELGTRQYLKIVRELDRQMRYMREAYDKAHPRA